MRIIRGRLKGRKFTPPKGIPTRPTTDFAKEGLFNILENYFNLAEISYLDLFSGTGNLCYEYASRGCTAITCVERFGKCVEFINCKIEEFEIEGVTVLKTDVFKFLPNSTRQFDIIFAGPPYALETMDMLPDLIFEYQILNKGGWFILEHNPAHNYDDHPFFIHKRKYGTTIFSIFGQ